MVPVWHVPVLSRQPAQHRPLASQWPAAPPIWQPWPRFVAALAEQLPPEQVEVAPHWPQSVHRPPAAPQAPALVPAWHTPAESMQPWHAHVPPTQAVFAGQATHWPLPVPQAAFVVPAMQVEPAQQPLQWHTPAAQVPPVRQAPPVTGAGAVQEPWLSQVDVWHVPRPARQLTQLLPPLPHVVLEAATQVPVESMHF
ncbi:MAG TPA: hypothetical protein VGQ83_23195 [Polyangia bacterium]